MVLWRACGELATYKAQAETRKENGFRPCDMWQLGSARRVPEQSQMCPKDECAQAARDPRGWSAWRVPGGAQRAVGHSWVTSEDSVPSQQIPSHRLEDSPRTLREGLSKVQNLIYGSHPRGSLGFWLVYPGKCCLTHWLEILPLGGLLDASCFSIMGGSWTAQFNSQVCVW